MADSVGVLVIGANNENSTLPTLICTWDAEFLLAIAIEQAPTIILQTGTLFERKPAAPPFLKIAPNYIRRIRKVNRFVTNGAKTVSFGMNRTFYQKFG